MGMVAAQRFDLEIQTGLAMVLACMEVRRDHHHSFQPRLNRDVSESAKKAAQDGPVVITDRGKALPCAADDL